MTGLPLDAPDWGSADAELHGAFGRARRAWRQRVLLQGLAWSISTILITLILLVVVSAVAGVTAGMLTVLRLGFVLAIVGAIAWWLIRPGFRHVDDARIALYFEERDPAFGQTLLSAVESIAPPVAARPSPALARRLASQAAAALHERDDGRAIERPRTRRALGQLAATAVVAAAILFLGPPSWRTLARGFVAPWTPADAIVPSRLVRVSPGDRTVPRGASLDITAHAIGFTPGEALLYFKRASQPEWDVLPMLPDSAGYFTLRLYDLDSTLTYAIEAGEVRSAEHRITVTDLPAVRRVGLELDYPGYTGLENERIEDGGDVAAVVGTVVEVRAAVTMAVRGGELRFDDGTRVPFAVRDSLAPVARFRVRRSGFYSIDLTAPDGTLVPGSVRWAVDALPDRPPVVRVLEPGRDTRATNVEEVSLAIAADDDYGVQSLGLRYTVNGGAEHTLALAGDLAAGTLTPREVHTLFLEEMSLAPGDLVAYYATATDGAGNEARSDIYFIEVRPFSRNYRQAEQGGGGGGGGGGGESQQELSSQQRDLIVATFNVQRDSAATERERFTEDVATIAVGQERLRERVQELSTEMVTRGAAAVDSSFVEIKQALDSARASMQIAVTALRAARLAEAVPAEQRALQQLQRAEALYRDVELQMNQDGGGGGGGGGGAAPEDLADLFELERDQLRNQYEAVQRESSAQPEAAREVDEAGDRLRDLARRLQQENERQQRMADAMAQRLGQNTGAGSGNAASNSGSAAASNSAANRRFAEEAEEEARRLERLARERNTPELQQAAQAARQAADALRRAAAGEQQGASEAVESLRDAANDVASGQESSARRESQRLASEAAELARDQAEFTRDAADLPARGDANRPAAVRQLQQEGARLARDAEQLQDDLERASRDVRGTDPRAAAALAEGSQRMREFQVPERMEQGNQFIADDRFAPQAVRQYNEQVGRVLGEVRDRVAQAAGSIGTSPERRQERALEQARELVRGMESMRERSEAASRSQSEPQGQQGQGEQGQGQPGPGPGQGQGQQGAAGRAGEPGGSALGGQRAAGGDARQLSRELQVRQGAAEQLRDELRQEGITIGSLDEAIATMRRLQQDRVMGDPTELARLQQEALESLRQAEFDLWQRHGGGATGLPAVGDPARVPPRYRQLVEEYYRAIARDRP